MRYLVNILLVLITGLAIGGYSAWWAVETESGFGSVKIGQWIAWPLAGSIDADPYTRARVAKDGFVPLGAGEGLAFYLSKDQFGKPLMRNCQYTIFGNTPPARLWTLSVQDENTRNIPALSGTANTAFSQSLLRRQDGSFSIAIGRHPSPGNWVAISGKGPMRLVIRLYDTPIAGSAGLAEPVMPRIVNGDCVA